MFEHKSQPILSRSQFVRRLVASTAVGVTAIAISLAAGMVGYHVVEKLTWIDSFLNASMLLGGMGPLEHQRSTTGKLFGGLYALYCGLAVISVAGIMFAPVFHR